MYQENTKIIWNAAPAKMNENRTPEFEVLNKLEKAVAADDHTEAFRQMSKFQSIFRKAELEAAS